MDDQAKIIETLQYIEALYAGATTEGERDAAANARERMRARLDRFEEADPPVEYKFTLRDVWSRKPARWGRFTDFSYSPMASRTASTFAHRLAK